MRGRPGRRIARVAVGSAVMAGTAGAVHHHQQKRWDSKEQEAAAAQQLADQQAQIDQLQQQQSAPPPPQYAPPPPQYAPPPQQYAPPAPAEPAAPSYMGELQQLATLRDQGIISAEDFEAKKKQLLGL